MLRELIIGLIIFVIYYAFLDYTSCPKEDFRSNLDINEDFKVVSGEIASDFNLDSFKSMNPVMCFQECNKKCECKSANYNKKTQMCSLKVVESPPITDNFDYVSYTKDPNKFVYIAARILP